MIKITQEKWDSIHNDYKGVVEDHLWNRQNKPELIGKKTVLSGCVSREIGSLLFEGLHFEIINKCLIGEEIKMANITDIKGKFSIINTSKNEIVVLSDENKEKICEIMSLFERISEQTFLTHNFSDFCIGDDICRVEIRSHGRWSYENTLQNSDETVQIYNLLKEQGWNISLHYFENIHGDDDEEESCFYEFVDSTGKFNKYVDVLVY